MILVIDSGSTKSDWVLIKDGKSNQRFETIGFNPLFHDSAFIAENIQHNPELIKIASAIQAVYFYGAACSSSERKTVVSKGLQAFFINATISVEHDLAAAAFATYNGSPSIACILGTGSNSCYFDGNHVSQMIPSLGFILGDEGSGSFFGKKLLSAFLYHHLPEELNIAFQKKYGLNKEIIFDKVYKQPNVNVFLASFMPFYREHKNHPFCHKILVDGLELFLQTHVACYPNNKILPIHFVGSVAYHFESELKQAAQNTGVLMGEIIHKPIDGLVRYHVNKLVR
jgi:glucosamine kinase